MQYKVVVKKYDSGLNELLKHQEKRYDVRTKKMRVFNTEKSKNDKICKNGLINSGMKRVVITKPIQIDYHFFVPNKKHDRSNTFSGFIKSFEDAMQELRIIKNDGYDDVLTPTLHFDVDKNNPRVEIIITEIE